MIRAARTSSFHKAKALFVVDLAHVTGNLMREAASDMHPYATVGARDSWRLCLRALCPAD